MIKNVLFFRSCYMLLGPCPKLIGDPKLRWCYLRNMLHNEHGSLQSEQKSYSSTFIPLHHKRIFRFFSGRYRKFRGVHPLENLSMLFTLSTCSREIPVQHSDHWATEFSYWRVALLLLLSNIFFIWVGRNDHWALYPAKPLRGNLCASVGSANEIWKLRGLCSIRRYSCIFQVVTSLSIRSFLHVNILAHLRRDCHLQRTL
jgi:hypothetical protein